MAKDLTGTNVMAQKEAALNFPVLLLQILRDSPEFGGSPIYLCTRSGGYTLPGGESYTERVLQMGDLVMSITPGGGVAKMSEFSLSVLNPEDDGTNYSDMLALYPLENDTIGLGMVFVTGAEGVADVLTLFDGMIQASKVEDVKWDISAKDGTASTLRDVPQELADAIEWPWIPMNNASLPLPWCFGSMNVEPYDGTGRRPILAPCVCVDLFNARYMSARLNKTYGQPYVWYPSQGFYGMIADYTQTGAIVKIDTAARWASLSPKRSLVSTDVVGWESCADGNVVTGTALANGKSLDLQMKGCQKIGTLTAIQVVITATGTYNYSLEKTGESSLSGSATGNKTISLATWTLISSTANWDFEAIQLFLDGTGSGAVVLEVALEITFNETESADRLSYPVFQAVTGAYDVATQLQDGAVIDTANLLLDHPINALVRLCRDKRTGMRMPTAQVTNTNLADERAKLPDWKFDFSLLQKLDFAGLNTFCQQARIRFFRTYDDRWKISVFDKFTPPVGAFFHATNISTTGTPETPPDQRVSRFNKTQGDISQVFSEFVINFGWDYALGKYTDQRVASHHYTFTGTGTMTWPGGAYGILVDVAAEFVTEGCQVGYRCYVTRDKAYTVTTVYDEHTLFVTPETPGDEVEESEDTYYIGANFDFKCFESSVRYKQTLQMPNLDLRFVQDAATAEAIRDAMVEYWSWRPDYVTFSTLENAVHLELGDFIVADHPALPPSKRPVPLGELPGAITSTATTLVLGDAVHAFREDDFMVLSPAPSLEVLAREVVYIVSIDDDAGSMVVERGAAGTVPRAWGSGDILSLVNAKWEVETLRFIPGTVEMEIVAREVSPDWYVPIGHVSDDGTPDFDDATAEQRAASGWVTYPDGRIIWARPDTALSHVG